MSNISLSSAGHNIFGQQFYGEPITAQEALERVGADFEVSLQPIIAANDRLASLLNGNISLDTEDTKVIDGQQFVSVDMLKRGIIQDYRTTMRMDDDTCLGLVSDRYGVVQNKEALDFIDMLTTGTIGSEQPLITSAGSLLGGRRVYIQAKFPEPIKMLGNNNDIIDMYVLISTSHDGSGAVQVAIEPQRVSCLNSVNYALQHCISKITFRHTANVGIRMDLLNKQNAEMAYRTLKLYDTYKAAFEHSLEELAKIKMTDKQMEEVVAKTILSADAFKVYKSSDLGINSEDISTRSRNIVNAIMDSNFAGVGQDIIAEKNTGLSLINGLTTYYQNEVDWKDNDKKFIALTEGSVQQKVQTMYDTLIKLAA